MSEGNPAGIRLPDSWAADWVLDRPLGSGSFSTVYRAVRKDRPNVEAAVKVIAVPASEAEAAALRMEGMNETQTQSYFDDIARQYVSEIDLMEDLKGTANIVSIEDYKVVRKPYGAGNYIFIRMELLRPLDSLLKERKMSEHEVIRLGIDICSALELCEGKHIIHRDIKPANIFINDRNPGHVFYKLGDFGVARSLESMTHGLSKKGTPNYMAPEIFLVKPYDHRADLYSLGITLYRLMNENRLPFIPAQDLSPATREEAMSRRLGGEPLPPPAKASEALGKVILRACEYDPEKRYASAREMKRALESLLSGSPEPQKPEASGTAAAPKQPEKSKMSGGMIAALALCACLVLIGILILIQVGKKQDVPEAVSVPVPTEAPAGVPIEIPTAVPTEIPTAVPTDVPTATPTEVPTAVPTEIQTAVPEEDLSVPAGVFLNRYGTLTVESANMRAGRSTDSELICQLKKGDKVYLIENQPDENGTPWTRVLAFGTEGYVMTAYLQLLPSWENEEMLRIVGQMPVFTATPEPLPEPEETVPVVTENASVPVDEQQSPAWDNIVVFGSYEQDNNLSNGAEPIEWIVLEEEGGRYLLLSRYILDVKQYHTAYEPVMWVNSSVRSWLNNEFAAAAFTAAEWDAVKTAEVVNGLDQGMVWGVNGGRNTEDQVFLLSYFEAGLYFGSNEERAAGCTAYAQARGASGFWWLRSPGTNQYNASCVKGNGVIDKMSVVSDSIGIRPAIVVSLPESGEPAANAAGAASQTARDAAANAAEAAAEAVQAAAAKAADEAAEAARAAANAVKAAEAGYIEGANEFGDWIRTGILAAEILDEHLEDGWPCKGLLVLGVQAGSPAENAGIREGDIIVSMGGVKTRTVSDLYSFLLRVKPGDEAAVKVRRPVYFIALGNGNYWFEYEEKSSGLTIRFE